MTEYDSTAFETAVPTEEANAIIVADDDGEIIDGSEDDDVDVRPDSCQCEDFNGEFDLCCWPCFREGFETPA